MKAQRHNIDFTTLSTPLISHWTLPLYTEICLSLPEVKLRQRLVIEIDPK